MVDPKLNAYLQPLDSPVAKPSEHISQVSQMSHFSYNPLGEPNTTAKGTFILYDKTGGTALFKYDPKTGVITILGSFVTNTVSSGTYSNITISGTSVMTGTLSQGVLSGVLFKAGTVANSTIGTPNLSGGTLNPTAYQTSGSLGATGAGTYVKTVSPGTTFGTMIFNNGLLVSIT